MYLEPAPTLRHAFRTHSLPPRLALASGALYFCCSNVVFSRCLVLPCHDKTCKSRGNRSRTRTMPRARPRPRQALHGAVGPHRLAVTGASYGLAATATAGSAAGSSSGAGQSTSSEPETLTLSVPPLAITSESALLQAVADSQCQIHELLTLLQVRYVAARAPCSKARQRISPPPSRL